MTNLLYSLMMLNERLEGFFIGLFSCSEKAQQVAKHYLSAVPGFRDYPCTYEITEKPVIGAIDPSGKVYMIWGWNEDKTRNGIDIWCSACYADFEEAQRAMGEAQQQMSRKEWSLDTYRIGRRRWTEGFARASSE